MKFLFVFALVVAIVYALPVDNVGEQQEVENEAVGVEDLEVKNSDGVDADRPKRHWGGL